MAKPGRAARSAGIRFERAVAEHFGTVTTRSVAPGVWDDDGDVVIPGYTVECKNYDSKQWAVRKWWLIVCTKALLHGTRPVLVLKRRGLPVEESLVICKLGDVS